MDLVRVAFGMGHIWKSLIFLKSPSFSKLSFGASALGKFYKVVVNLQVRLMHFNESELDLNYEHLSKKSSPVVFSREIIRNNSQYYFHEMRDRKKQKKNSIQHEKFSGKKLS